MQPIDADVDAAELEPGAYLLPHARTEMMQSRRRNGTSVALATYWSHNFSDDTGPIVIFAHGMAGCAENFLFQMRQCRHQFCAFDMLGCGASEKAHALLDGDIDARLYGAAQLCDDLENVWRRATDGGARRCVIVTHSYGTSLVTSWLARLERQAGLAVAGRSAAQRLKIEGVVLVCTHSTLPPVSGTRMVRLGQRLPACVQMAALNIYMGPLRWWHLLFEGDAASNGSIGSLATPEARRLWLRWESSKTAWLYAAMLTTCTWASQDDFARAYARTPVAACWGLEDYLTPPDARFWAHIKELQRPGVEAVPIRALCAARVFSGNAHWPMLDNAQFDAWLWPVVDRMLNLETKERIISIGADLDLAPAQPLRQPCAVCGCQAQFKCAQCLETLYCSVGCQRLHWQRGHGYACCDRVAG